MVAVCELCCLILLCCLISFCPCFHVAGKGVFTTCRIEKGKFLTYYTGELISEEEAVRRESQYNDSHGSFMYFFKHKRRILWLVTTMCNIIIQSVCVCSLICT